MMTGDSVGVGATGAPAAGAHVKVWDPVVRLFHWLVVTGCILNLFILEEGHLAHRVTGYVIAGALAVRIIWGFVGSRHARFSDFVPTPRRLADYIGASLRGEQPRMLGHNPLAALMMLALMFLLGATALTGWMSTLDVFWGVRLLRHLHGFFANGIMALAFLHAAAGLFESWLHRENLIWSMVTGRKRA
jgi:cytochrome b